MRRSGSIWAGNSVKVSRRSDGKHEGEQQIQLTLSQLTWSPSKSDISGVVFLHISSSTAPSNRLLARFNSRSFFIWLNSFGILPSNLLFDRSYICADLLMFSINNASYSRFLVKLFDFMWISDSLFKVYNPVGKGPEKLLFAKLSLVRFLRFPSSVGTIPWNNSPLLPIQLYDNETWNNEYW